MGARLFLSFWATVVMGATYVHGQTAPYAKASLGTYHMQALEAFQQEIAKDLFVPAEVVNSFPATVGYEVGLMHQYDDRQAYGGYFSYRSTGGRIHYADYSGQVKIDQLLSSYSLGMLYTGRLSAMDTEEKVVPWAFIKLSGAYTLFDLEQYVEVGPRKESETFYLKSLNIGVEPGLSLHIPIAFFSLNPELSYELQLPGKLFADNGGYLLNPQEEAVKANWSGVRVGLSITKQF